MEKEKGLFTALLYRENAMYCLFLTFRWVFLEKWWFLSAFGRLLEVWTPRVTEAPPSDPGHPRHLGFDGTYSREQQEVWQSRGKPETRFPALQRWIWRSQAWHERIGRVTESNLPDGETAQAGFRPAFLIARVPPGTRTSIFPKSLSDCSVAGPSQPRKEDSAERPTIREARMENDSQNDAVVTVVFIPPVNFSCAMSSWIFWGV